jgi:hypothetical protein
MKYKTFRMLMVGAGLVVAFGAAGSCLLCAGRKMTEPRPEATATAAMPTAPATASAPPVAVSSEPSALTDMQREVLAASKKQFSGDKLKDVLPGRPYKVNLYKDPGESQVNRLKIDLDRDDKWDEKWTLDKSGGVLRQVAPADDERYTVEYRLEGDHWRKKQ